MGIQLAPIEGTPYAGGTATGVIYLDANGLQRSDGPTVDASGNVAVGGDINVGSNKSVYIAGVQGAYDIGAGSAQFKTNLTYDAIIEGYTNVLLSPGALGGSGTYVEINNGTAGVLRDLKARTVNATAQAITDTPLAVNGAVGQTADLATIGDVTIDAASNLTVGGDLDVLGVAEFNVSGGGGFHISHNLNADWVSTHQDRFFAVGHYSAVVASLWSPKIESLFSPSEVARTALGVCGKVGQTADIFSVFDDATSKTQLLGVDPSGDITASGNLTLSSPTVPASASATGTAGTVSWDADYIYICTATDTWKRVAISTW